MNHQLSAKMVVQSELNSSTEQFDPIILATVPITVFPRGMFGNTPDLSPYATHVRQALLAQGPYLKIRRAVGVSRTIGCRGPPEDDGIGEGGVEEALLRRRWRRWDVYRLSFRPQGGYQKFCPGNASPGGFVMLCPNRFPGDRQWSADNPTPYCSSGWIICVEFHCRHCQRRGEPKLAGIPRCSKTPGRDRFTRLQSRKKLSLPARPLRIPPIGRGPWNRKHFGFGVCQAASWLRFRLNNGALQCKMR
ncbi:hypothetical protein THAOC_27924 [Thalassiosira oceanica]|uniref:Uncharacterized protein n=1 Tax=Thalassiosira oceanica TaxID=159749 RepID=K0RVC7_THAOC|nr:hypothetical protein THAOC_27924 [Thalassiosira oceanica]|eukprot:EJK52771.1 hypothetical protein THAOC_27924 [Thalassiosira oceanica]